MQQLSLEQIDSRLSKKLTPNRLDKLATPQMNAYLGVQQIKMEIQIKDKKENTFDNSLY